MAESQSSQSDTAFDKAGNTGFRHLMNATRFSAKGLKAAFVNESAFRQELGLLFVLTPTAALICETIFQFAALLFSMLMVIVVELMNSAVEAAIDRIGTDHHHLSGLAKDYGSAAVMIALLASGILWIAVLVQRFIL